MWTRSATASPAVRARRHNETITVLVKASAATKAKVDVRIYDPKGTQVFRKVYDNASFSAGVTRTFKPVWYISATRRLGTYSVRIRIYAAGSSTLLSDRARAATFRVKG